MLVYLTNMDSFIKADIFFFISSIATVILSILISILLIYTIKAAKNLETISKTLREGLGESKEILKDLKTRVEDNVIIRLLFPTSQRKRRTVLKDENREGND